MDNPHLYSENNYSTRVLSEKYLTKYIPLLNWKENEEIIDIGCGDGRVSLEIIVPKLPKHFKNLICVDVSPSAVALAKSKNNNSKVEFFDLDIATTSLPKSFLNRFQHAFSFYCLHWVFDQKQALRNIYSMLKPQGEAVFTYIISAPLYTAQEILTKSEKWRQYFEKIEEFLPLFRHSADVDREFKTYLSEAGFTCQECLIEDLVLTFPDFSVFLNFSHAVNRFIKFIPKEKQDEYKVEYIDEIMKQKSVHVEINGIEKYVSIEYKHMVVISSKTL